jgi:hypothetical protein
VNCIYANFETGYSFVLLIGKVVLPGLKMYSMSSKVKSSGTLVWARDETLMILLSGDSLKHFNRRKVNKK